MFKLVIQDDEGKTTVVPLIRDEITIGRKEGNTIRLTERNVSRRHARILRNNGEVHIEDLGSYNGIRVNNARIAERVSLRVSDQVQIGDYKLYLKAEGVEQVDDARTMPIERVETNSATDIMPAIAPSAPPTAPMGVPTTPSPPSPPGAMVGNPNRTLVAIADTDPAGRPVATAAAVAALTAPVGYGKLVVLSSNFAGKEFELSRPQMIIGRTDENDIVINHRSISRNHAKLVREPETGRYTISDLQSSNGVRVNGQDYGKVELRRGDVVDLGHVRLRFVEPGEDFLFSRDAVITDVPDVGGKKGLLVAIILGVVVLGGIGAFFALRGNKDEPKVVEPGNGTGGTNENNPNGSNGSDHVAVAAIDAGEVVIEMADALVPAAASDDVKLECAKLTTEREWAKLAACSDRLSASDAEGAKTLHAKAAAEIKAEMASTNLGDAIKKQDFGAARKELAKIPADSVYRADAKTNFDDASQKVVDDLRALAKTAVGEKNCVSALAKVIRDADNKGLVDSLRGISCPKEVVVVKDPGHVKDPTNGANPGSGTNPGSASKPPPEVCDADALKSKGDEHLQNGMDSAALTAFEASMKCRPDSNLLKLAFMASCKSKNWAKAKYYFSRLPQATSSGISQICVRNGFDPTK